MVEVTMIRLLPLKQRNNPVEQHNAQRTILRACENNEKSATGILQLQSFIQGTQTTISQNRKAL